VKARKRSEVTLASVKELKDALVTEQSQAVDVADMAISAIDTLLNLSTWALGILAFVVGIIAIFGYGMIANAAKRAAKDVAKSETHTYIKSVEFSDLLEVAIKKEVKERVKDKVILTFMTEDNDGYGGKDAFPSAPKKETQG